MDRININLPPDLHTSIKSLAAQRNEPNIASLIRLALHEFVQEHKDAAPHTHAPLLCGVLRPENVEAVRADLVPQLMAMCGAKWHTPEQFIQDIELDVDWLAKMLDASVAYIATETEYFGDSVPTVLVYRQLPRFNNYTNKVMTVSVLQQWHKDEFWRFIRGDAKQHVPYNMEAVVRHTVTLPAPDKYSDVDDDTLNDAVATAWESEVNLPIEECIFEFLQRRRHVDVLQVVHTLFNENDHLLRVPQAHDKTKGVQYAYLAPYSQYVPPMGGDAQAVWQDFTALWPFAPELVDFTIDALVSDNTDNNYVFLEAPSNGAKTFFAGCAARNIIGASVIRGSDALLQHNTLGYRIRHHHMSLIQFIDDAECAFGEEPHMLSMGRTCIDSEGIPTTTTTKARVFMGVDFTRTLVDEAKCSAPAGGGTPATTRYAMLRVPNEGADINDRALFKTMGGEQYKRSLGDAIAHRTSTRLNQYLVMGEKDAGKVGSANVLEFQRKYGASI